MCQKRQAEPPSSLNITRRSSILESKKGEKRLENVGTKLELVLPRPYPGSGPIRGKIEQHRILYFISLPMSQKKGGSIKSRFLDLCREQGSLKLSSIVNTWREREGDEGTAHYLKSLVRDCDEFHPTGDGFYVHKPRLFQGAEFRISPTEEEVQQNFLLLGHRMIPFYPPNYPEQDVTIVDEHGEELSRRTVSLPWEYIKKFNLAAPPAYQVQPVDQSLQEKIETLIQSAEQENERMSDGPPDYSGILYRLDMELSDQDHPVQVYTYELSNRTSLLARVEEYEDGIISVRPDPVGKREHLTEIANARRAIHRGVSIHKPEGVPVVPLMTQTYARNPELLENPKFYWVHSLLSSEDLKIKNEHISPIVVRSVLEDRSNQEDDMMLEAGMSMMFGHLLDKWNNQPEKLVEEAFEKWIQEDPEAPGYLWALTQMGEPCHEPLQRMIRKDEEEAVYFAVIGLEQTWTRDLEKSLRFLVADDRLSEKNRMMVLNLLMENGSEETQEFAMNTISSMSIFDEMNLEEMTPDRILASNKQIRSELLEMESGEVQDVIGRAFPGGYNTPLAFYPGSTLVYATDREKRNLGVEMVRQSGHPGASAFLSDLSEGPLPPLADLAGPDVAAPTAKDSPGTGRFLGSCLTGHDPFGVVSGVVLCTMDSWWHILGFSVRPGEGFDYAEMVFCPEPIESTQEAWDLLELGDYNPVPFPAPMKAIKDMLLNTEHAVLSRSGVLPEEYIISKPVLYIPSEEETETGGAWREEFDTFWDQQKEWTDDDSFQDSFRAALEHRAGIRWAPECHYKDHDIEHSMKLDPPSGFCQDFLEELQRRCVHLGKLYFQNDEREYAQTLREAFDRLERAKTSDDPSAVAPLQRLLEEWKQEAEEAMESFPFPGV